MHRLLRGSVVLVCVGCTSPIEREQILKGDGTYNFKIPGEATSLVVVNEYEVVADLHRDMVAPTAFGNLIVKHNGRGDIFDVIERSGISLEEHYAELVLMHVGSALERTFDDVVPIAERRAQQQLRHGSIKGQAVGGGFTDDVLQFTVDEVERVADAYQRRVQSSGASGFDVDLFHREILPRPTPKPTMAAFLAGATKDEMTALTNRAISARRRINSDAINASYPGATSSVHEYQVRAPFDSATVQASTIYAPVDSSLYVAAYLSYFPLTGFDSTEKWVGWMDRLSFDLGVAATGIGDRAQEMLDANDMNLVAGIGFRVHEKFSISFGDLIHIAKDADERARHRLYAGVSVDVLKVINAISSD